MILPKQLYRGDDDANLLRNVRANWNSGWLQTNLGSGGNGQAIHSAPLLALAERHANSNWPKTHFLSFSRNRFMAETYALGGTSKKLKPVHATADPWDTSIFTLECDRFTVEKELSSGVYFCSYAHRDHEGAVAPMVDIARKIQDAQRPARIPVILIDVLRALEAETDSPEVVSAREKAKWDQEWLVLPCEPFCEVGRPELTALLDDSCIGAREKFRIVP